MSRWGPRKVPVSIPRTGEDQQGFASGRYLDQVVVEPVRRTPQSTPCHGSLVIYIPRRGYHRRVRLPWLSWSNRAEEPPVPPRHP